MTGGDELQAWLETAAPPVCAAHRSAHLGGVVCVGASAPFTVAEPGLDPPALDLCAWCFDRWLAALVPVPR